MGEDSTLLKCFWTISLVMVYFLQTKNGKCSRGVDSSYFVEGEEISIVCLPKTDFFAKRLFFAKNIAENVWQVKMRNY